MLRKAKRANQCFPKAKQKLKSFLDFGVKYLLSRCGGGRELPHMKKIYAAWDMSRNAEDPNARSTARNYQGLHSKICAIAEEHVRPLSAAQISQQDAQDRTDEAVDHMDVEMASTTEVFAGEVAAVLATNVTPEMDVATDGMVTAFSGASNKPATHKQGVRDGCQMWYVN